MIRAIGIDIVSIARIQELMERPAFVKRTLTPRERLRELTPQYVAGRWAAKEAARKCLPELKGWQEIEILNGDSGEPAASSAAIPPKARLHISISHDREYATAVAVLENLA